MGKPKKSKVTKLKEVDSKVVNVGDDDLALIKESEKTVLIKRANLSIVVERFEKEKINHMQEIDKAIENHYSLINMIRKKMDLPDSVTFDPEKLVFMLE